jgi:gluconate 2-dehydrogenase gamma chain
VLTQVNKNGIDFAALGEPNLKASQFFSQLLSDTKPCLVSESSWLKN